MLLDVAKGKSLNYDAFEKPFIYDTLKNASLMTGFIIKNTLFLMPLKYQYRQMERQH